MCDLSHYFIAVELDEQSKQVLTEFCQMNQSVYHFNKWVHPQDYHLTLVFLGQSSDIIVNDTFEKITDALKNIHSFPIDVTYVDVFGAEMRPRIFWAGIKANEKLSHIQSITYEQCKENGFTLDERPFTPHITLARQWKNNERFHRDILQNLSKPITLKVNKITLYQTMIGKIPKYKVKQCILLQD